MNELLINGENAYTTWGVRMGEGFLDVIGASAPMKDFIENKSRLEHGKRVIINNPKVDEREITLSFTIEGNSQSDYLRIVRGVRLAEARIQHQYRRLRLRIKT